VQVTAQVTWAQFNSIHLGEKLISQQPVTPGFSIYCTSNLDGTGTCNRVDNNEAIPCLIVPGGVINCGQRNEISIQCVSYGASSDAQSYFYCTRRTDPGIRNNRLNTDRFAPLNPSNQTPAESKIPNSNPLQNPLTNPFD
jgi:hypothetical protein